MGKLICADLFKGRRVRYADATYSIAKLIEVDKRVVLELPDGTQRIVSRSRLLTDLSEESAALEDETEDPELRRSTPPVIWEHMTPVQKIDWYHLLVLVLFLLPHARRSPKSAPFRNAYEEAICWLQVVRTHGRVNSTKNWSGKRLNEILRRVRRHGGGLAAIRTQIVPALRRKRSDARIVRAKGAILEVVRQKPGASVANVNRAAKYRIKTGMR